MDEGTDYTDRITVAGDSNSETLTVLTVKLSDEREFFCQVNGMAAGNGERKTHLAVFGKQVLTLREGCPALAAFRRLMSDCSIVVQIPRKLQ